MKPAYRNKTSGPGPVPVLISLLALAVGLAALAIAIVALVRTAEPAPTPNAATATASLTPAAGHDDAPAGRSPIPEPGETITKPIAPTRLASLDDGKAPEPGQVLPWIEAAGYLGHEVTVEGTIVDTHLLDSGAICFLNFHKDFRGKFYIAMFREAFADLPEKPDTYYMGKTLRVTGLVKPHRGRPQIEVHRLDQIEVIENDDE